MAKIMTIMLVLSGVAGILLVLGTLLCKKSEASFNKMSPFECGFSPRDSSRGSFSLQFFLISLIFVIFDIELILLYPFVFLGKNTWFMESSVVFLLFLLLLTWGLFHEWSQSFLEWVV